MSKKPKVRRKAIDCKLVEESKTSPGYFKYVITIQEKDGTVHSVPAYGIDMQDAIKRLLKVESSERINKIYVNKIEPITLAIISFSWIASVIFAAVTNDYRYAFYGVISMFGIVTVISIHRFINGR